MLGDQAAEESTAKLGVHPGNMEVNIHTGIFVSNIYYCRIKIKLICPAIPIAALN